MTVIWMLDKEPLDENLENNLKQLNCGIRYIDYYKWIFDESKIPLEKDYDKNPIVYHGSVNCSRRIEKTTSWTPGTWLNSNFDCNYYYDFYYEYLLNTPFIMTTVGSLFKTEQQEMIKNLFGQNIFIRPNSGLKKFTGFPLNIKDLDFEIGCLKQIYNLQNYDFVLISKKANISKEWRVFVAENKVVTGSLYIQNSMMKEEAIDDRHKAMAYCQNILNNSNWRPASVFSMDVCEDWNGNLNLLEINSFNSSGTYDCDCEKLIKEVEEVAEKEFKNYWMIANGPYS